MRIYIGYTLVSMSQPKDRLEDKRGIDDKMSKGIWEEMAKRKIDEVRMAETKREREKRGDKKTNDR